MERTTVLVDKACYERGCACHDPRVDTESVEVMRTRTDDDDACALAFVSTREDHGPESQIAKLLRQQNHERCLACAADGDISDADDGVLQAIALQHAVFVKLVACAD